MILLSEAINEMRKLSNEDPNNSFRISFFKYDEKLQTGGELKVLENCRLLVSTEKKNNSPSKNSKPDEYKKSPNHYLNSTINMRDMKTGRLIKVHTRLIKRFNDQQIFW